MTITRAREILGVTATMMSDGKIEAIVECFNRLIETGLQKFECEHSTVSIKGCNKYVDHK